MFTTYRTTAWKSEHTHISTTTAKQLYNNNNKKQKLLQEFIFYGNNWPFVTTSWYLVDMRTKANPSVQLHVQSIRHLCYVNENTHETAILVLWAQLNKSKNNVNISCYSGHNTIFYLVSGVKITFYPWFLQAQQTRPSFKEEHTVVMVSCTTTTLFFSLMTYAKVECMVVMQT
jgi:hypothetical protein